MRFRNSLKSGLAREKWTTSAARAAKVMLAAAVLPAAFVFVGTGTAAASTCVDGDRAGAAAVASSNTRDIAETISQGSSGIVKITLRQDRVSGCVWGLVSGNAKDGSQIWLDRTDGPAKSAVGFRKVSSGNGSTYTGLYNFAETSTGIRACGRQADADSRDIGCTKVYYRNY